MVCSNSQITGVDFSENYFPMVHKITYCIFILLMLIYAETAFLCGSLEEEMYMECPWGLKTNRDKILILDKCIYGLVHWACQYYKEAVGILNKLVFFGSDIDKCLFVHESSKELFLLLSNWVIIWWSDTASIDEVIQQLKQNGLV